MVKPNEARKDLLDRLTPKRSVTFKNKGRFGSHPDDHLTQSIHNKATDLYFAVGLSVLVLNCNRCWWLYIGVDNT